MDPRRSILALVSVLALMTLVGCRVHSGPGGLAGVEASPEPDRHRFVFETIEAAAIDALAHAHFETKPADRNRLLIASIERVKGGYAWKQPRRSVGTFLGTKPPIVRHRLGPNDVATYVVHPRTGHSGIDRLNEGPSESMRRIVEDLDPRHRPIYILTPSRKVIVVESGWKTSTVAELPRRRNAGGIYTAEME